MKFKSSRFATIKSISSHLDRNPGAMQVMAHASDVLKAGRLYQQFISTALGRVSRVANLKAGVIIIHTEHGAAANKLRQQTQHLIDAFLLKGLECTGIEIRVQPTIISETESIATLKPISEQALTNLDQVAQKMRPGSPLKAKIEFLIQRAARR